MSGEYQIPECAACAELRKRVEALEQEIASLRAGLPLRIEIGKDKDAWDVESELVEREYGNSEIPRCERCNDVLPIQGVHICWPMQTTRTA